MCSYVSSLLVGLIQAHGYKYHPYMDNSVSHSDRSYDLQTCMSNHLQTLYLNNSLLLYLK